MIRCTMAASVSLSTQQSPSVLSTSVTLPISKQKVPNRLIKASTTESLANPCTGEPNEHHFRLYSRFKGCGMVLTGNVMVDRKHKESPRNVVLDSTSDLKLFQKWSRVVAKGKFIMQLNHPGRQCPLAARGLFQNPVAPTSGLQARLILPSWLGSVLGYWLLKPARELCTEELPSIVEQFARSAKLAQGSGFDGVEIHAAHGYLLSTFLSPAGNFRTDEYGRDARGRRRLLLEVITAVRDVTSPDFIVGVKINSKDRRTEGEERENECIDLVKELFQLQKLDFIELSGGSFEDSHFILNCTQRDDAAAFFQPFAERLQHALGQAKEINSSKTNPLLVLTGGLRKFETMKTIIETKTADLIGLGRPLIMNPAFCDEILRNPKTESRSFNLTFVVLKDILEPALNVLWYQRQLERLSSGLEPDENLSVLYTITVTFFRVYIWDWWSILPKYRENRSKVD